MNGNTHATELRAYAQALLALADRIDGARQSTDNGASRTSAPAQNVTMGAVASDADLDGQYGNPVVKFDPKRWDGESCKGLPFSECSSAFLEAYAEALEWSAERPKPGKEKYAAYDARDAARARGWARRNAARVETLRGTSADNPFESMSSGAGSSANDDDGIPF